MVTRKHCHPCEAPLNANLWLLGSYVMMGDVRRPTMPVLEYAEPDPFAARRAVHTWIAVGILLVGSWLMFMAGPFHFLIPAMLVAVAWSPFRRRPRTILAAVAFTLFFSPMTLAAVRGTSDYFAGTATIQGMGMSRSDSPVDPLTRLQRSHNGCVVMGNEWIVHGPYNSMVRLWLKVHGPMRGTYAGPYPDEPTARACVAGAKALDLTQLPTDSLLIDGGVIKLRAGLGREIMQGIREGLAVNPGDAALIRLYGGARATIYKGQ